MTEGFLGYDFARLYGMPIVTSLIKYEGQCIQTGSALEGLTKLNVPNPETHVEAISKLKVNEVYNVGFVTAEVTIH